MESGNRLKETLFFSSLHVYQDPHFFPFLIPLQYDAHLNPFFSLNAKVQNRKGMGETLPTIIFSRTYSQTKSEQPECINLTTQNLNPGVANIPKEQKCA
jgi:hypothetical protein